VAHNATTILAHCSCVGKRRVHFINLVSGLSNSRLSCSVSYVDSRA
jgi:hypothetical protein